MRHLLLFAAAAAVAGLMLGSGAAKAASVPKLDGLSGQATQAEPARYRYRYRYGFRPHYYRPYRYYAPHSYYYGYYPYRPYYRSYGYWNRPYYGHRYWW